MNQFYQLPFPSFSLGIVHPEESTCEIYRRRFEDLPNVSTYAIRYEDLQPHDCFVTAGNAFGMMTAGIDAAVVRVLGPTIMEAVQFKIMNEFLGEQPVGTAFVAATEDAERPFLCHAPTMRVPGSISGTDQVYRATWAALLAIYQFNAQNNNRIESVRFPAMGCGFGGVSYDESARQMSVAYRHFLNPPHRLDWNFVAARQKAIFYDQGKMVIR